MKIFITGAGGFFGRHLVERLIAEGHQVTTFTRRPLFVPGMAAHVCGDVADLRSLVEAMSGAEAVYHVAGMVSYDSADLERQRMTNVLGTRNVMEAAKVNRVQRVVHTSSIAAIGIPDVMGDEQTVYNLSGRGLTYCDTKHEAEKIVQEYCLQGLNAVVLNPGITLGEGDTHAHHRTIFSIISSGWLLGCPAGGVMFSDIKDVIDAHVRALVRGDAGKRYIIGNANLSYRDAGTVFSGIFGVPAPRIILPGWFLHSAAVMSEGWSNLARSSPVLTKQAAWLAQQKIFFSWDKATRELGYVPTPFHLTVRRISKHYLGKPQSTEAVRAAESVDIPSAL